MYNHLLIIADGEIQENSLHVTARARAERLHEWVETSEWKAEIQDAMREAEIDSTQADYPEGTFPHPMDPEDYIETLRDVLSEHDIDVYLDDLDLPSQLDAVRAA